MRLCLSRWWMPHVFNSHKARFNVCSKFNQQVHGQTNRATFDGNQKNTEVLERNNWTWSFLQEGRCEGLVAYADSNYAGDIEDKKSTSGYAFMLGS